MITLCRHWLGARHAALAALVLLALGAATAAARAESTPPSPAPAKDEPPAAAGPAAPSPQAPEPAAQAPETIPPAAEQPKPPEKAPIAKKPRRPLTEAEVRELPPLKRFELSLEKGAALLDDVKDNTFGYDESAFYYMIEKVLKTSADLYKPDAQVTPFRALMAMPSSYRGQPVTLQGVYMTVAPFSPPPLAIWKDVRTLYECTLREPPLSEIRPIATVIVLDNPMTYLHAYDEVRVKGYFYKVRNYEFQREDESGKILTGETSAPMLVARRLEPLSGPAPGTGLRPPPGTAPMGLQGAFSDPWLIVMVGLLFIMILAFFFVRQRVKAKTHASSEHSFRGHKFRLRRPDRIEPPAPLGPGGADGGPKP